MSPSLFSPRQLAGRLNQIKGKGLTPAGLQRLRETAMANRPWTRSTGPKTARGKAIVAANGKARQKGSLSIRERRALTADVTGMIAVMAEARQAAMRTVQPQG